jgi:hypothetical protein
MKCYEGRREGDHGLACVYVDAVPLNPRFDLRNHSPNGFEWGYGGSGPAQLALALLADHLGNDERALRLYQAKWQVVATFKMTGWTLTSEEIDAALEQIEGPRSIAQATHV